MRSTVNIRIRGAAIFTFLYFSLHSSGPVAAVTDAHICAVSDAQRAAGAMIMMAAENNFIKITRKALRIFN
jgi:hypothetical protein